MGSITISSGSTPSLKYTWTEDGDGELTKVTYPAGGHTRYEYSPLNVPYKSGDMICTGLTVSVASAKYECASASSCESGQENTTKYSYSWTAYAANGASVQYPDGTKIGHVFAANPLMTIGSGVQTKTGPQYSMVEISQNTYDLSGNLVKSVATDYTIQTSDITKTPVCGSAGSVSSVYLGSLPCRITTTEYNGGTTISSKVETSYQPYTFMNPGSFGYSDTSGTLTTVAGLLDNPVSVVEYGYDGAVMRQTASKWSSNYGNNGHILNVKTSSEILDGGGNFAAETDYEYDNYPNGISASGATSHISVGNQRGNVTGITKYISTSSKLPSYAIGYDDAGNVVSVKDPLGHTTTWIYADNFSNGACSPSSGSAQAYVSQKVNALGQITVYAVNSCFGDLAWVKDKNGNTTTNSYDGLGRLTGMSFPDKGKHATSYNDNPPISKTDVISDGVSTETIYDGINLPIRSATFESSQSSIYVDTTYDQLNRVGSVSNPYRSQSDASYGITSYSYDALGRKIYQCQPDNATTSSTQCSPGSAFQKWSYIGNTTIFQDEKASQWQRTTDALGNLTKVVEPNGSITYYAYDTLNNLTCVAQAGTSNTAFTSCSAAPSTWLLRSFKYDGLSRLILSVTICKSRDRFY